MRKTLVIFALIAAIAAGCATTRPFVSDRISVVTRGRGPDIILIPGLAGHRDQWNAVADTLDDRYRLHLVQVKGFAGVPPEANAEGVVSAPVAEEIARYIAEQRLKRPAVIGHSMGGTIGMMLAARHAQRVGRLMVLDVMPYLGSMFGPPGGKPEDLRAAADQFRAQIMNAPLGEGPLAQMFPTMTLRDDMRPALIEQVRSTDRRTAANAFHELIVTDLRPELRNITVPTTVLYVLSPEVPMSEAQYDAAMRDLYANAPAARLIRIQDSRHFLQWDQEARFIEEVDAFMRD